MDEALRTELVRLASEMELEPQQVENVVTLLDEGNTVPFITRYRKERTGNLDEERIRLIQRQTAGLRQLLERRQTILRTIEGQGKLTDSLAQAIRSATTMRRLEDLYLPYKPKKLTLATLARQRGLEPLAEAVWNGEEAVRSLDEVLPGMVDPAKELHSVEDVRTGIKHLVALRISEHAEARAAAREVFWTGELVTSKVASDPAPASTPEAGGPAGRDRQAEFRNYFAYSESLRHIPPHRVLAINRGERLGILKVRVELDRARLCQAVEGQLPLANHPHQELLRECVVDAVDRLLYRSLEREVRNELAELAERHSVLAFVRNLRHLLLQAPVSNRTVLAIDPGYRTGCKYALLDGIGKLLEQGVIHPHPHRKKKRDRVGPKASPDVPNANPSPEVPNANPLPEAPAGPVDPVLTEPVANEPGSSDGAPRGSAEVVAADPVSSEAPVTEPTVPGVAGELAEGTDDGGPPATTAPCSASATEGSPVEPAAAALALPPGPVLSKRERARATVIELCRKHGVSVIAIGNGSGCRETEEFIAQIVAEELPEVPYVIVNEAGASVYSASRIGREEFPDFDATLRSAISIGRRLQDPLSELVKIDPPNIGVGMYQHDVNHRRLKQSLSEVVESCVNFVGVDLNTASVPLLQYVSGLNQLRARNLVEYRTANGRFHNREQLKAIAGIGPAVFTQAAGFLRITGGDQHFDSTWIHPESYPVAQQLLARVGFGPEILSDRAGLEALRASLAQVNPKQMAEELGWGEPTIRDILDQLTRPGRDPREDLPKPIFRHGILRIEDLTCGMELKGTVLNIVDFGVFVDVGLKDSGLVHISELSDRFVRNPHDVVTIGDTVTTWVIGVDVERRRVSLTMIPEERRRARQQRSRQRSAPTAPAQAVPTPAPQPAADKGAEQGERTRERAQQSQQDRPAPQVPRRGKPRRSRDPETRRPSKPLPVRLSDKQLQGEEELYSFGQLNAFFRHHQNRRDKADSQDG